MMSSYYHPAKEADMAAMTEPLCLERGNVAAAPDVGACVTDRRQMGLNLPDDDHESC